MAPNIRNGVLAGLVSTCLALVSATGGLAAKPGNSLNAKACQKDGWQSLVREDGSAFNNQEECVSYGAQDGVLTPKPRGLDLCDALSGTFSTTNTTASQAAFLTTEGATLVWTCNGIPTHPTEGEINLLGDACWFDGSPTGTPLVGILGGSMPFNAMCFRWPG